MKPSLACPDWEERLLAGRSLIPDLPIDQARGARAVAIFDKLRLADVIGTPTMAVACAPWFREIVRNIFGARDPVTRAQWIREVMLLVPKKNSKALGLDTLIATPSGWSTMGQIRVGDLVLDAAGRPTRVVCKSEVFTGHRCLEIEFSTGEKVICDEDHLWVTDAHADRDRQRRDDRKAPRPSAKTARQIERTLHVRSGDYTISNHRTALASALELPDAALPIDPYVLGAWLGDGHSDGARITAAAADAPYLVHQIEAAGHPARISATDVRTGAVTVSIASEPGNSPRVYRFSTEAKRLGVFGNKHLPMAYLRGSHAQRLALLQGLMDTDGHISNAGQACFSSTLPALRAGVVELVASLGLKPTVREYRARLNGADCGPYWRIQFWPFDETPVFRLPRKLERQTASAAKNSARSRTRQIVGVREVPSVPTQCIGVDSDCHQFLVTRSLIPTHNTTYGALLMLVALLMNERPQAALIMTAPTHDITALAYDAAVGAIDLDPVLKKILRPRDHLKTIEHRQSGAELSMMTFDPRVLTGQKTVATLIDELHVCGKMRKAASAIRQLRGGMGPFLEAFLVFITTQSEEPPAGVYATELQRARGIRDGRITGNMLPVLYEFPEAMQKDQDVWRDPDNWPLVTPNLGRSVFLPTLIEGYEQAVEGGEADLRGWASQHLNVEIGLALHANAWPGALYWEGCAIETLTLDELIERSEVITVGIDGGGLDDLLGLAVIGRCAETRKWLLWAHAWAHPSVLERNKQEAARFLDFQKQGDLTLVQQVGDDVDDVAEICSQVWESELMDQIGVDPVGLGGILDALVEKGIPEEKVVGISQGWRMSGAIKTVERKLAAGQVEHAGSALMAWCAGNARVVPVGNAINITKAASGTGKIDPLMATFNAGDLMSRNPSAGPEYQFFAVG